MKLERTENGRTVTREATGSEAVKLMGKGWTTPVAAKPETKKKPKK